MSSAVPVFVLLCLLFAGYTALLYRAEEQTYPDAAGINPSHASDGKLVWQKYNCQSCHQLYGLGGYIGPDLTDLYSGKKGNETVLAAIIRSGNRAMPAYKIDSTEMRALLAFFKAMDAGQDADPRKFSSKPNGMIQYEE